MSKEKFWVSDIIFLVVFPRPLFITFCSFFRELPSSPSTMTYILNGPIQGLQFASLQYFSTLYAISSLKNLNIASWAINIQDAYENFYIFNAHLFYSVRRWGGQQDRQIYLLSYSFFKISKLHSLISANILIL